MLIASLATSSLGIFIFLFILWKRLKEDFTSEIIFKIGFIILFGIAVGTSISYKFSHDYFLWFGFIGGLLGLFMAVFKFRTKFYEIFEAFIIAVLPWLSFIFLAHSVVTSSFSSFIAFLVILFLIFISYFLETHYKSFSWYKSGKIGFTGLCILGLIFVSRFVLAFFKVSVLSFVGKFETVISGVGFIVCFLLLLNLSRLKE